MRSAPGSVSHVPLQSSLDSSGSRALTFHPIDLADETVTQSGTSLEGQNPAL